jgi:hypothetical protein
MATTTTPIKPVFNQFGVYTEDGGAPTVKEYTIDPEEATVLRWGMPVTLASGLLNDAGEATATILGFCVHDEAPRDLIEDAIPVMPGPGTKMLVYVSDSRNIFIGGVETTTAAADVGPTPVDLGLASGVYYVDRAASATDVFIILALDPRDSVGATNGRVHFVVNPAKREYLL